MESINSVNVLSIDEEKLKFRAIVGLQAVGGISNRGIYKFNMPVPTSIANSDYYSQCTMKITNFAAAGQAGNNVPGWADRIAGVGVKISALEVRLDIPSSQTTSLTTQTPPGQPGFLPTGEQRIGGFMEFLNLDIVSVGDGGGNVDLIANPDCAAWRGLSNSEPIVCGNPFGKEITCTLIDPMSNRPCFIHNNGFPNFEDGEYQFSLDITMIKNK